LEEKVKCILQTDEQRHANDKHDVALCDSNETPHDTAVSACRLFFKHKTRQMSKHAQDTSGDT
jgi:hypothetical protein